MESQAVGDSTGSSTPLTFERHAKDLPKGEIEKFHGRSEQGMVLFCSCTGYVHNIPYSSDINKTCSGNSPQTWWGLLMIF